MENLDQKLDQLKKDNPIMKVAANLGFVFNEKDITVAVHCFNTVAHPNGDRHPSLVLQPDTNTFECKSCGEKGDALTLIQKIKGCEFKEAVLFLDPNFYPSKTDNVFHPTDYLEYWKSRGISDETKEEFCLVLNKFFLTIPLGDGRNKYRQFLSEPKYKNPIGSAILYKTSEAKNGIVYLVESELDAIKLHQEIGEAVWSSTGGATTFKDEWIKDFEGITKVYLCYDNDPAGQKGAFIAAKKIGVEKCFNITLPEGKDVTEYFVKFNHTAEHFKTLKDSAVSVQSLHTQKLTEYVENALNFGSMTDEEMFKKRDRRESLHFGIYKMDEGEFKIDIAPGFIVIAAPQGIGKSWMMLHLARAFYLNNYKKSVIITLEMPKDALRERALQSFNHLTQQQYENGADITEGARLLRDSKLVIQEFGIEDASKITIEALENIVELYYSQGYRVFQFDHLHQISGMSDGAKEKDVSDKWAMAIKSITAKYKDIWFIAYAQATKEAAKSVVTKEGIRYGVRFIDVCDMFFSLNKPAAFTKTKNLAKVDLEEEFNATNSRLIFIYLGKARYSSLGTHGWLVYHSKTGNYTQTEDEDVQFDSNLQFTRKKPKQFAPLPEYLQREELF